MLRRWVSLTSTCVLPRPSSGRPWHIVRPERERIDDALRRYHHQRWRSKRRGIWRRKMNESKPIPQGQENFERALVIGAFGEIGIDLTIASTQYAAATVSYRFMSGSGFFVDFEIERNAPLFSEELRAVEIVGSARVKDQLNDVIGYSISIGGSGKILGIEGYTFGNVLWPDDMISLPSKIDAVIKKHERLRGF